jgi:hypothetical protein
MAYKRLTEPERRRVVRLYVEERQTAEAIGAALGVTGRCVLNVLKAAGVARREPKFAGWDAQARAEIAGEPRLARALAALEGAYVVTLRRREE